MTPASKIGLIRAELDRLGCTNPYVFADQVSAAWTWDGIRISSRDHSRVIDFEVLLDVLKKLPYNIGLPAFWNHIRSLDLSKLYDEYNRRSEEEVRKLLAKEEHKPRKSPRRDSRRRSPKPRTRA